MASVYVGMLYMVQPKGSSPIEVQRCALGVDDKKGLVQADTEKKILAGNYWQRPTGERSKPCERLWYERKRADCPNDVHWFHDLKDSRVALSLDKRKASNQKKPKAFLTGEDVFECAGDGNFLCG